MVLLLRLAVIAFAVFAGAATATGAADSLQDSIRPVPNATIFKGKLAKYLLNGLFVHTYESTEAYGDWSIILENEHHLIVLESQSMPNSARELHRYLGSLNKPIAGVLISYHGVGPDSFPGIPIYATPEAIAHIKSDKMEKAFARYAEKFPGVDPKIVIPTHPLIDPCFTIGDITMCLQPPDVASYAGSKDGLDLPAYCLSLPEHGIYYMHILGGDMHAIIHSIDEIDPYIEYLENLKEQGYEIFLSAHHKPETKAGLDTKIAYLRTIKMVATVAATHDEFISEMRRLEPTRKGEKYLQMTAENLYP